MAAASSRLDRDVKPSDTPFAITVLIDSGQDRDLHLSDPSTIGLSMQRLIQTVRHAGVTVRTNPVSTVTDQ